MEKRIRPFSNGSQYLDWIYNNCDRCTKQYDPDRHGPPLCPIEEEMAYACIADGTISPTMARRCGITAETRGHYIWDCPERRPIPAHPDVPVIVPLPGQLELFGEDS